MNEFLRYTPDDWDPPYEGDEESVIYGPIPAPAAGTVTWAWVGAVGQTSAVVTAKIANGASTRLKVATDSGLTTGVVFGASDTVDSDGYAKMDTPTLSAATQFFYGVEIDGTVDTTKIGSFRTAPAGAASFEVAFSSCNLTAITSNAYQRILDRDPDLWFQVGDFHYEDIATDTPSLFRAAYDTQMAKGDSQALLYRSVASGYIWSDHDFGGNNSGASAVAKPAAQSTYRQCTPHYTLPSGTDIYQTFVWGRVRFILTDGRSNKSPNGDTDNSSKTILGSTQKQWLKDTIDAATEPLIVWANDVPWTGATVVGDDHWASYNTERQELATHISGTGKRVVYLHGDQHAVGANDGTSNDPGGLPVVSAAPLANTFSNKGSYTSGPFPTSGAGNIFQYGYLTITDTGGSTITLGYVGYDSSDVSQATLTVTVALTTPKVMLVPSQAVHRSRSW